MFSALKRRGKYRRNARKKSAQNAPVNDLHGGEAHQEQRPVQFLPALCGFVSSGDRTHGDIRPVRPAYRIPIPAKELQDLSFFYENYTGQI